MTADLIVTRFLSAAALDAHHLPGQRPLSWVPSARPTQGPPTLLPKSPAHSLEQLVAGRKFGRSRGESDQWLAGMRRQLRDGCRRGGRQAEQLPVRLNNPLGGYSGKSLNGAFWSGASDGCDSNPLPTRLSQEPGIPASCGLSCYCCMAVLMQTPRRLRRRPRVTTTTAAAAGGSGIVSGCQTNGSQTR